MNRILAWFARTRVRLSLSHIPEALLIQVPVTTYAILTHFPVVFGLRAGIIAVVAWYWSRKKLEVEISDGIAGESHAFTWMDGWFPWQWSFYQQLDVLFPLASSVIWALIAWKILV